MSLAPTTPIVAGVGQLTRRFDPESDLAGLAEPVGMMAEAALMAACDSGARSAKVNRYLPSACGGSLLKKVGSIRVMDTLSWHYRDPGALIASQLGLSNFESIVTTTGGNSPQMLVADTAAAILRGDLDAAIIVGAEAMRTRVAARKAGIPLPWTTQEPAASKGVKVLGSRRDPSTETELARGLDRPVHVFPLFENALRSAACETIEDHQVKVSELWARFAEVARKNPHAWTTNAPGPEQIRTVGAGNRMIGFPYPKLMNANIQVDQAAALIMCSLEVARAAGIPQDRWVFPVSAAHAEDHWFISHRQDMCSSPAIRVVGKAGLEAAGSGIDDVAYLDLYSCFPCAVQIAAAELRVGLNDPSRSLTVTGGLGFAGGPGNNYVTHSIAAMVDSLRKDPGALGLVTGLGWYFTKHAVGLYSTTPPARGFLAVNPQKEIDSLPQRSTMTGYAGPATVETYTVIHARDGSPSRAILSCITEEGLRVWGSIEAQSGGFAQDQLACMTQSEVCHSKVRLEHDGTLELG
ncbi:MAG: hypothetical protein M1115_07300 [Actinobacteria bacterium]|nr:hypothetical protein [Actinomycetota bacterium]